MWIIIWLITALKQAIAFCLSVYNSMFLPLSLSLSLFLSLSLILILAVKHHGKRQMDTPAVYRPEAVTRTHTHKHTHAHSHTQGWPWRASVSRRWWVCSVGVPMAILLFICLSQLSHPRAPIWVTALWKTQHNSNTTVTQRKQQLHNPTITQFHHVTHIFPVSQWLSTDTQAVIY